MKFSVACLLSILVLMHHTIGLAQRNDDESQVPEYTLPDPLTASDGTNIESVQQWEQTRRPQILQLFKEHVYGTMPPAPKKPFSAEVTKEAKFKLPVDPDDESGRSVEVRMKEIAVRFGDGENAPVANVVMFLPTDTEEPVPAFLGYNFDGSHTLVGDRELTLKKTFRRKSKRWEMPTDEQRGTSASRWQIGLIVSRGFGLISLHYGDIDPDFDDGFKNGIHGLYPELQNRDDNWTSIGGWAWGLHRILDYLETGSDIDAKRVAVIGHSRLGKTSLWAGATDPRFALVISNNSGCGGAALARRHYGETVARINRVFPHWFNKKHKEYNENETKLPVDQHMLISLMAPRPAYVASASLDTWADPKGEFLSAFHAGPVYRLYGKKGLGIDQPEIPETDSPTGETVGYHIRTGKHDVTRYDWQQYLDFADRHMNQ